MKKRIRKDDQKEKTIIDDISFRSFLQGSEESQRSRETQTYLKGKTLEAK